MCCVAHIQQSFLYLRCSSRPKDYDTKQQGQIKMTELVYEMTRVQIEEQCMQTRHVFLHTVIRIKNINIHVRLCDFTPIGAPKKTPRHLGAGITNKWGKHSYSVARQDDLRILSHPLCRGLCHSLNLNVFTQLY